MGSPALIIRRSLVRVQAGPSSKPALSGGFRALETSVFSQLGPKRGPTESRLRCIEVHTVPAAFGEVMSEVKPRMAVAFHFFNDYDTRYEVYEGVRRTYDGPLTMATDLLVWNVTKDEIRVREAIVDDAVWPAPSPTPPDEPDPSERVQFSEFIAGGRFDVSEVLDPLVDSFKKEHGLD